MKYVVLIPDGSADRPHAELDGQTPLKAARTPHFDRLARAGQLGLAQTVPDGFPAGSDVANLCLSGYDPHLYYTGRAPLEAASLGIPLGPSDVAFRCNLVYVANGIMEDFSSGHISTAEASQLIAFLQEKLGDIAGAFHPGLSYRHILVASGKGAQASCTPPHDISGQKIESHLPQGEDSEWLREIMARSAGLLTDHPVNQARTAAGKAPANMVWLWGQGTAPQMPTLSERFGLSGSVISAVDLVKGLGKYMGLKVVNVPGATGYLDTDYEAKARYALAELKTQDFVYVHVEAPDEASHMGDLDAKLTAIENFDTRLVGPLLDGLTAWPEHRLLMLPDHATPLASKTHAADAVPFLRFDSGRNAGREQGFDEPSAAASGLKFERGWELMEWFIKASV